LVNDEFELKGLITVKDIQKKLKYPQLNPRTTRAACAWPGPSGATGDFLERAAPR